MITLASSSEKSFQLWNKASCLSGVTPDNWKISWSCEISVREYFMKTFHICFTLLWSFFNNKKPRPRSDSFLVSSTKQIIVCPIQGTHNSLKKLVRSCLNIFLNSINLRPPGGPSQFSVHSLMKLFYCHMLSTKQIVSGFSFSPLVYMINPPLVLLTRKSLSKICTNLLSTC